jgi:alpha-mannosidase
LKIKEGKKMEIFLVPHFHYDPVWIKTQYDYTEREKNSAFKIIKEHLKIAEKEKNYVFILEQIPYLKPYWDNFPEDRKLIKKLIKEKRLEIVGGMYNEPQTTLISGENIIRNISYGKLYNRYILNFESITCWVVDLFGHDVNFPQFLKKSQIKFCSFARGPYKRGWGIPPEEIFFKTEFWWIAPDGSKILTHLMEPGHYGYGYGELRKQEYDFEKIKNIILELSSYAEKFSLVPFLLFPLGGDMALPIYWLSKFVEDYKKTEKEIKIFLATASKYFEKIKREKIFIPPLSLDFNPVNNGCDVSYVDLKIANRKI